MVTIVFYIPAIWHLSARRSFLFGVDLSIGFCRFLTQCLLFSCYATQGTTPVAFQMILQACLRVFHVTSGALDLATEKDARLAPPYALQLHVQERVELFGKAEGLECKTPGFNAVRRSGCHR